jgi:hypothetical protein
MAFFGYSLYHIKPQIHLFEIVTAAASASTHPDPGRGDALVAKMSVNSPD